MLTILAETDWSIVISAIGSVLVLVAGAIGSQWYRVASARWAFERQQAADTEKAKVADAAGARRQKRDTTDELYRILDVKEKDAMEWREQVHEINNKLGVVSNQLAICEWDRKRLAQIVEDQGRAMDRAGIHVTYRSFPDQPAATPLPDAKSDGVAK